MGLENCPNCNAIFVRTKFKDVCDNCKKEEDKQFDKVYSFIRKSSNRTATMEQVVEETGVEEELIIKFIKTGKLRISQFPNLGIPCEKCGTPTKNGKICDDCSVALKSELELFEKEQARLQDLSERERKATYYTKKNLED